MLFVSSGVTEISGLTSGASGASGTSGVSSGASGASSGTSGVSSGASGASPGTSGVSSGSTAFSLTVTFIFFSASPAFTIISVLPADFASINPSLSIVATSSLDEIYSISVPYGVTITFNCSVSPSINSISSFSKPITGICNVSSSDKK